MPHNAMVSIHQEEARGGDDSPHCDFSWTAWSHNNFAERRRIVRFRGNGNVVTIEMNEDDAEALVDAMKCIAPDQFQNPRSLHDGHFVGSND